MTVNSTAGWVQRDTYKSYSKPIRQSPQDDREYRLIKLPNGLEAMLVHDAKADKAAASLDVAVGHLNDPVRCAYCNLRSLAVRRNLTYVVRRMICLA